jgi:pimeloyl-ACP methyl ester carboxylesterase
MGLRRTKICECHACVRVVALVMVLLAASACGDGKGEGTSTSGGTPTPEVERVGPVLFEGDDFYEPPEPLPAGEPGELIWIEPIDAPPQMLAWRILYHSQSTSGSDVAVSGFVVAPDQEPPEQGWPVIALGHGTTGLADACAPSADPNLLDVLSLIPNLFGFPYVVTATDYEGLGTPGHHPYMVGESGARGVLDSVRAARAIEAAHASNRFVIWGHSQGGQAALFAGRLAPDLAPDLDLLGVAALAAPSQLAVLSNTLSDSYFRGYLPMVISSYAETYPDAPVESALTTAALERIAVVDEGCADEIMSTYASLDAILVDQSLWSSEPWRSLVELNEPGRGKVEAPVLIIHGDDDEQVPVGTSEVLFEELCAHGASVQRIVYPGQSHSGVIFASATDLSQWIGDRFAGVPPINECEN